MNTKTLLYFKHLQNIFVIMPHVTSGMKARAHSMADIII